jgi:hypothetical protein
MLRMTNKSPGAQSSTMAGSTRESQQAATSIRGCLSLLHKLPIERIVVGEILLAEALEAL